MVGRPIRVLVVDDEPHLRRLLKTSLLAQNCHVIEAGDTATALRRFSAEPIDLIILDLGLPDQSGLAVLETVRRTSAVPAW
jgi:DNA-binding response OmpR family regulator